MNKNLALCLSLGGLVALGTAWGCSSSSTELGVDSPDAGVVEDGASDAHADPSNTTKIYATFVSHNEQPISNAPCAAAFATKETYLANRALLVKFAEGLVARGATYNHQDDYIFLDLVAQYDGEAAVNANTGGMNVVKYLETMGKGQISIDVHHHPIKGIGLADVAYRLNALGIEDNGVVGGFLYSPAEDSNVDEMKLGAVNGVVGEEHKDKTWFPKILWGGATAGHQGEDSAESGIWRPKSNADFYADDPSSVLINVGNATNPKEGAGLKTLIEMARAGTLEPGKLYTAAHMVNQCELSDAIIDEYFAYIDEINTAVAEGYVEWHTLNQTANDWRDKYHSDPFYLKMGTTSTTDAGTPLEGGKPPLEGGKPADGGI